MNELVFEVTQEGDGERFLAALFTCFLQSQCFRSGIPRSTREAVRGYYFDKPEERAQSIRLHLVRDEVLAT